MNKNIQYWLGVLLCLVSMTTMAQEPIIEWEKRYDSKGPISDDPSISKTIATDAAGNIYVTGNSYNINSSNSIITTIKYSQSGTKLWVKEYEGEGFTTVSALTVDNLGGVFVAGGSSIVRYDAITGEEAWGFSTDGFYIRGITVDNQGGLYVTGSKEFDDTGTDYLTIRYDAATGAEMWASRYDKRIADAAAAIATDNMGGIYVTGYSGGGEYTLDIATVRYDAVTGKQSWASRYYTANFFSSNIDLAVDNQGGVYVTGTSYNNVTSYDYVTISYNATTGTENWVKNYDGGYNSYDWATAITADNQGGIYVTGYSGGKDSFTDFATVRYDAATGLKTWESRFDGGNQYTDRPNALTVDNQGGVYLTGTILIDNASSFATIRYETSNGGQTWVSRYSEEDNGWDEARAIATDNQGSVYVTGREYSGATGADLVTIRYDVTKGDQKWVQHYNSTGSQSDYGIAVATDAIGNIYVAGISANYNTSALDSIVTIKYSPAGEELWVKVREGETYIDFAAAALTVDNKGGVYVAGGNTLIRYDAITGEETWVSKNRLDITAITVDNQGELYVTGSKDFDDTGTDYLTVRYDAATGAETWAKRYDAGRNATDRAIAIVTDNEGGIYVTGSSQGDDTGSDYVTVRYDAATGLKTWDSRFDGGNRYNDRPSAITVDSQGGVYVTGTSNITSTNSDYATIRYDAMTGKQSWVGRYVGLTNGYDRATAIVVDDKGGVYVTGTSSSIGGEEAEEEYDYVTIRYDVYSGKEKWVSRYDSKGYDFATAMAVDLEGHIYVTGHSDKGRGGAFNTIKYNPTDGVIIWKVQTDEGGESDAARDIVLDKEGNIIVTGYSFRLGTGNDFLTIKYSQRECPTLAKAAVQGSTTAAVGSSGSVYTLPASGATSFAWSITDDNGTAYTDFTGQGTSSITVQWPSSPHFYKLSVTYGGATGCPTLTATTYVHVFDVEAGFVTGGGWSTSPANVSYELMKEESRAYWAIGARYKKGEKDRAQGSLLLLLQGGTFAFRGTNVKDGSLVIAGDKAYYTGQGILTHRSRAGNIISDPRRFGYLVAATDGDYGIGKGKDQLRIQVWEMNSDGSKGTIIYDNQASCTSVNLDDNAAACATISGGNIVIHTPKMKSSKNNALFSAKNEPTTPELIAYPTAFSDRTTLTFTTEYDTEFSLELFDLKGALVRQIATGIAEGGNLYEQELLAENLHKGLYLVRLTTGSRVQTVKLIIER